MSRRIITTGVQGFGPLPRMVRAQAGDAALEQLLAAFEVPPGLLERPKARLPLSDMVAIFDRAGDMLGDPLLGLAVGREMQPEDYGVWVRYAVAGPTLGHGLARACRAIRYYQAAGSMRADLHGGLVRFAYHHLGVAGPLVRQHADHVLLPTIRFARRYLGADWLPLWVEVPYGAVGGAKDLADRIGVEVRYDRPGLGIVFDRGLLDTPGRCQAPSIAELRRLVGGAADRELTRALIDVVDLRLNNGAVAIDGAARRLGLQPRTLQRRLQAEGRSYRQIVDAARRARAEEALAITSAPIAEIALGLGYDEPAHFTRAFQRWHGCSPSHWRRIRHAATGKAPLAAE